MHWNRKMRSVCRATLTQENRNLRRAAGHMMKSAAWLSRKLGEVACPPEGWTLCGECGFHGEAGPWCGRCWHEAAMDAVFAAETGKEAGRVQ